MYLGVDVGGTNLAAGLVDEQGTILRKVSRPVDKTMDDRALCGEIAALCRQTAREGGLVPEQLRAVGVGFPGQVDDRAGTVVQTPNMPFRSTPFRALFQQELNVPVHLGNDANCAAIGEYWAGAAKGCDPAVIITLGTGIGGGMVSGGRVFTGFAGSGMEVGHMLTRPGGQLCGCGNRGCWEQHGSATALIRLTKAEMETNRDSLLWQVCGGDLDRVEGRTAFQAAQQGDKTALGVLEQYLQALSEGMISLINILQPQIICLGGGISHAPEELLLQPLRRLVEQGCYDKAHPTAIVRAALGNDAGIVGAAMLCQVAG
ncbi:MAG: ROK family protein [Clostridium sp.]|nr:ROK family protein [Clostridium sp.]